MGSLNAENINVYTHDYPQSLEELIIMVHQVAEKDPLDVERLIRLMNNYRCDPIELKQYASFQTDKYTRSLIDAGNGKFNLILLCWGPGQGSAIHDHTNSHCILKCIEGKLNETRYKQPSSNDSEMSVQGEKMKCIADNDIDAGVATYMHDRIGLHRVKNPSTLENAMSLHLYMPPFNFCRAFDENTSATVTFPMSFHSNNGQLS